ncbi:MAG: YdaU family protein [Candidatus Eremiobacteraeota bacterium]|nr:YdaU family protein [Candidatus Eremiobacteraeota bacterium]
MANRLKRLAYCERVSESAIIEFVLQEFFSLGDDATLGRVIHDSALPLRRNQPLPANEPLTLNQLLAELQSARDRLVASFQEWNEQPDPESLKAVGLARTQLAVVLNQITRSQQAQQDANGALPETR